jgi:hypothetical protein
MVNAREREESEKDLLIIAGETFILKVNFFFSINYRCGIGCGATTFIEKATFQICGPHF